MIKFFRKIRQEMLTKNKFSKYLLYAIGEIILVVIGILIALQLNIAREKSESRNVEIIHLKNILQDLEQEVVDLENIIIFRKNQTKAAEIIIDFIDGKNKDLVSLNKNQFLVFIWRVHHPNNNSFNELKSSGKLSKIKSNKIRQLLLKLDSKYVEIEMVEEHLKFEYHEFLYKKNINYIDYYLMFKSREKSNFTKNDSLLLKENIAAIRGDKSLKNTYVLASANTSFLSSLCEKILDIVNQTIELVEENIGVEK